jgi:chemotaxis protein CheX
MPRTFELPEALDLPAAGILAKSLLGLTGAGLSIDAGKVQRLGASCLQVLLSAALTWKAEGHSLILAQGSDRFLDDLRLLGFTPETFLTGARAQ